LEHGEGSCFMIFTVADQSAEGMEPGEPALDFAAAGVGAQFATFLGGFPTEIVLVVGDEPVTIFFGTRWSRGSQSWARSHYSS
jgi:hypothetical protein